MSGWWVACCGEIEGAEDDDGGWWFRGEYECGEVGVWRDFEVEAEMDLQTHHMACGYWHDPDAEVD